MRRATVGGRGGLQGTLLLFSSDINEIELHKGSKKKKMWKKILKEQIDRSKFGKTNRQTKKALWRERRLSGRPTSSSLLPAVPDHPAPKCIQIVFLAFPLRFSGTYQAVLKMNGPSSLPSSFFSSPPPFVGCFLSTHQQKHTQASLWRFIYTF